MRRSGTSWLGGLDVSVISRLLDLSKLSLESWSVFFRPAYCRSHGPPFGRRAIDYDRQTTRGDGSGAVLPPNPALPSRGKLRQIQFLLPDVGAGRRVRVAGRTPVPRPLRFPPDPRREEAGAGADGAARRTQGSSIGRRRGK